MVNKISRKFIVISAVVGMVFMGGLTLTSNLHASGDEHPNAEALKKAVEENPNAQALKQAIKDKTNAVVVKVSGMTCGACANKVKTALESCDGVIKAKVMTKAGKAVVSVEEGKSINKELIKAVEKAGFKADI